MSSPRNTHVTSWNPLQLQSALLQSALLVLGLAFSTSCGLFGSDEPDSEAQGACDEYTVTDWWPVDVAGQTFEPWDIVPIPHTAGGIDSQGFGTAIPAEVVWDGVVYSELANESTPIGMPTEPGTYDFRVQVVGCPAMGVDYSLNVAYPTAPSSAPAPLLTGDDIRGLKVAWTPDGTHYLALIYDGLITTRVKVNAEDDSIVESWSCEGGGCGGSLEYSADNRWFAPGGNLYEWRDEAWFLFTKLDGNIFFEPSGESVIVDMDGTIARVDLTSGEHTTVAVVAARVRSVSSDGMVVVGGEVWDPDTGLKVPASDLSDTVIEAWVPTANRVIVSGGLDGSGTVKLASAEPAEIVSPANCNIGYGVHQMLVDPLEELVVVYGRVVSSTSIYNPWFEACQVIDNWSSLSPSQPMAFALTGFDSIFQRTESAAWHPDGSELLSGGLTGVYRHSRADIESLFAP